MQKLVINVPSVSAWSKQTHMMEAFLPQTTKMSNSKYINLF